MQTPIQLPGEALDATAYLAYPEWTDNLLHEIGTPDKRYDQLFLQAGAPKPAYWARNIWQEPRVLRFESINDAAHQLRSWQRSWFPYGDKYQRRLAFIAEALPAVALKDRDFPFALAPGPIGSFTLLDEHTLLASARTSSPFPGGILQFHENKKDPPSSAYLKLWEGLVRQKKLPAAGSRCLDAGACPGGWTWVLDSLGAEVLALDRSPLDPSLMARPTIRFRGGNAFAVKPQNLHEFGWDRLDWLVSDLICYPAKLYEWVSLWLESGKVDNCVVTIKMQGSPDWETTAAFAAIEGSTVYHGNYNKNELTWIWSSQTAGQELLR